MNPRLLCSLLPHDNLSARKARSNQREFSHLQGERFPTVFGPWPH
jgi:hypothetical protein